MPAYAFWNNKGGVGKSFLCFVAACEYAHRHPETDVYVLDMCPQANVSESLLGGFSKSAKGFDALTKGRVRRTVGGYLEARLNSPFRSPRRVTQYLVQAAEFNGKIPANLYLVCGDNLLELQAEAIRQTSQLVMPQNAWKSVIEWLRDLRVRLQRRSGTRDTVFMIDCNPSFAIYTQLALAAADDVVVPFTADDSSRRGIENIVALLYGIADVKRSAYARIAFSDRAKDEGVSVPRLHTFVNNRVTLYEGKPSRAFRAASKNIRQTVDKYHESHRTIFSSPMKKPGSGFIDVPDYHSASIVAGMTGTPIHKLTAGPKQLAGERVQINKDPLRRYREALEKFVDRF